MTKCTILFVFCSDNGLKMWGWYYINIKVCQVIGVDGDMIGQSLKWCAQLGQ